MEMELPANLKRLDIYALPVFPAADVAPLMADAELTDLAADIKAHELHKPLVVAIIGGEEVLVDGRNRRAACKIAGIEPESTMLPDGEDPTAYVLSANVHRCHMTKGQRAMVVAKIYPEPETLKRGGSSVSEQHGIPKGKLSEARTVLRYSTNGDLARDVLSGAKQLDAAYQVARERKKDAELSDEDRLAELRTRYPDLPTP